MLTAYCEGHRHLLESEAPGSRHSTVFPSSDSPASQRSYDNCQTGSNPWTSHTTKHTHRASQKTVPSVFIPNMSKHCPV